MDPIRRMQIFERKIVFMKSLARAALIAALYVVLVYVFQPISFGAVQLRVAESLTVLPILFPEAIAGLYIGALLANLLGGLGLWDIFGGSLVTLLAAYVTYHFRDSWIAYASPIILNALLVSLYLQFIFAQPYFFVAASIGLGQLVAVVGLGLPLVRFLKQMLAKR